MPENDLGIGADDDDLGFSDPVTNIIGQQKRAEFLATQALDNDPAAASRAMELEKLTKVPGSVISLDQENFEKQHKAAITRALLNNNQYLADYANSHSLAATVSQNDWANLDNVSQAIQKFGEGPVIGQMAKQFKAQMEGFRKGFGSEPIGSWADDQSEAQKRFQVEHPNIWNFIKSPAYEISDTAELFTRTFSGALGALHNSLKTAAMQFGYDDQTGEQFARNILGVVESRMADVGGTGIHPPEGAIKSVNDAAKVAKPYLDAGKVPPVGADPLIDRIHAESAKHEMDNLDEVMKRAKSTETIESEPSWDRFQEVHDMLRNRVAGIDFEGVEKLYPEGKLPEPGDNLLGDVPGIKEKIEAAQKAGSDVEIPVSDLTKVPDEVYKELHDYIRTWPGAMTLKEAKELPKAETQGAPPVDLPPDEMMRDAGLTDYEIRNQKRDPDPTKIRQIKEGYTYINGDWKKVTPEVVEEARATVERNEIAKAADREKLDAAFAKEERPRVSNILGSDWQPQGLTGEAKQYKEAAYNALEVKYGYSQRQLAKYQRVLDNATKAETQGAKEIKSEDKIDLYHGTTKDFEGLPDAKYATNKYEQAVFYSDKPEVASGYAEGEGGRVFKTSVDRNSLYHPTQAELEAFMEKGDFVQQALAKSKELGKEGVHFDLNGEHIYALHRVPDEMGVVNSIRRAANLVVRPVVEQEFKDIIPYDKAIAGQDVLDAKQKPSGVKSLHTFKFKDLLDKTDFSQLSPDARIVSEFFGRYLKSVVGDMDVHVIAKADMAKLFAERPDTPAYHRIFHDTGYHFLTFTDEILNGSFPTWYQGHLVLHEGVHGITSDAIFKYPRIKRSIEAVMKEADDWLKKTNPRQREINDYAFTDAHEFMSEALSNAGFRKTIQETPISNALAKQLKLDEKTSSMWDALRQILKDAWQRVRGKAPNNSVLDAVLRIGDMIEEARDTGKAPKGGTQFGEQIDPKAMGITKKEQAVMLERIAKEAEADQEYMQKVAERSERLKQTKEWKENEAKVRETVEKELNTRPDIAADRLLREGMLYGDKVRRVRLDESKLTPEQKAMLDPEHYGKNGINPDQLASMLGYNSDKGLIDQLARLTAERKNEGITPTAHLNKLRDIETERRMKAQYGFLDENILREAKEHVLNPTVMDRLAESYMRAGIRAGIPVEELSKEKLIADAKATVGQMPIGTIDSDKFLKKGGDIRRKMEKEGRVGSPTEEYKLQQDATMQTFYAKEALQYEKERAKADRLEKKISKRVVKDIPEEWTNWIHTILLKGGADLVKRTPEDLAERISKFPSSNFLEFAKRQDKTYGRPMNFPAEMFDDWKKAREKMTLDEWRGWQGTIESLYNYGKQAESFEMEGRARDWKEHRTLLIEKAEKERFTKPIPYSPNQSSFKNLVGDANRLFHGLLWLESTFNRVDHGSPYGLWKRSFTYQGSRAVNQLSAWIKDFSKELSETSVYDTNLRKSVESIFVHPHTQELIQMNKENVRQVIKYMGTKTGEDKLIRGYMLPKEYTPEQYGLAKDKLYSWLGRVSDKKDWDFAEAIWKMNGKIWDKYERMVTNVGAVPPQKVELNPITIHGKRYEGGYVKLSYDQDIAQGSEKLLGMPVDPDDAMGESGFYKTTTPRSHERARTGYAGPLYLKMDRDAAQMTNVLRDAAIRPFVINTAKAFNDPVFRNATKVYLGKAVDEMLVPYLESIAGMGARQSGKGVLAERLIEYFSRNTVARLIGGNVNTIAKHTLSAAVNSMVQVGPINLAREAAGQLEKGDLHPTLTNREYVMRDSQGLQRRKTTALETMGGQWQERIGTREGWRDWLAEKGSAIIGQFDLESAIPTYISAFKQSKIDQIAETGTFDHGLARDIAERAVRAAHGDSAISTRPELMRGGAMARTLARLYGFFNSNLQRNYEAMWRTKAAFKEWGEGDKESARKDAAIAIKQLVSANLYIALVEELVTPLPYSHDETWGEWAGKTILYASSGMIPVVREMVHAWLTGFPTTLGILDTGLRSFSDLYRDLSNGAKAFDAEHGGKTLKALNSVVGSVKGWTNDEIGNIIKYTWDVTHDSKETPETLPEHLRDILHGRAKERKAR